MFVYVTVIWTHHQEYVCREMHRLLGDDFKLVLTLPLDDEGCRERMAMGWNLFPPREDWIIGPPRTSAEAAQIDYSRYVLDADALFIGFSGFDRLVLQRLRMGKLTFLQGERCFKRARKLRDWLNPRMLKHWLDFAWKLHFKGVNCLTMSHWCAGDLAFFRTCKGRVWRWGYLVPVSDRPTEKPAHEKVRIGWCGRFLCLKNVKDILQACSLLENPLARKIEVTLVGDGPEKESLVRLAGDLGLADVVSFLPFMPARDAKEFMRGLDVYVFPSGRQEGWGAALAEAMDASCAVVANEAAGSTLALVKDGENGFAYKDGDIATLARRLGELVESPALRKRLGLAAWQTMQGWSPAVGAERLVALANALLDGRRPPEHKSGPLVLEG